MLAVEYLHLHVYMQQRPSPERVDELMLLIVSHFGVPYLYCTACCGRNRLGEKSAPVMNAVEWGTCEVPMGISGFLKRSPCCWYSNDKRHGRKCYRQDIAGVCELCLGVTRTR